MRYTKIKQTKEQLTQMPRSELISLLVYYSHQLGRMTDSAEQLTIELKREDRNIKNQSFPYMALESNVSEVIANHDI